VILVRDTDLGLAFLDVEELFTVESLASHSIILSGSAAGEGQFPNCPYTSFLGEFAIGQRELTEQY